MDSSREGFTCPNASYGCQFLAPSESDRLDHFRNDCHFHSVLCFKCKRQVLSVNSASHYHHLSDNAPSLPSAVHQFSDREQDIKLVEELKAISQGQRLLQESIKECASGVASLTTARKDVPELVEEVKAMRQKQSSLETIARDSHEAQGHLTAKLSNDEHLINQLVEGVATLRNSLQEVKKDIRRSVLLFPTPSAE